MNQNENEDLNVLKELVSQKNKHYVNEHVSIAKGMKSSPSACTLYDCVFSLLHVLLLSMFVAPYLCESDQ